ncbi:MAG: Zn-dependent oligopeptidase [Gammaproteobacteria bacterium]|nr:Zn-dependent oligopeptidase [Gammaproteobacteria bacterium]
MTYIESITKQVIELIEYTYKKIIELKDQEKTFNNVIQPLIDLDIIISKIKRILEFLPAVHPIEKIRDVCNESVSQLEHLQIKYNLDKSFFNALNRYNQNRSEEEFKGLTPEKIRYFNNLMRDYKNNGLSDDKKSNNDKSGKLLEIKQQIDSRCKQFNKNLTDASQASFKYSAELLDGIPKEWLTEHEVKDHPGLYEIKLNKSDYDKIMDYAKNREVRKTIYLAFNSQAKEKNIPLLKEIIMLRQQFASKLGFHSHADLMSPIRMAKNSKNIRRFLDEMKGLKPLFQTRLEKIIEFAKEEKGEDFILHNYDISYYNRLLNEKTLEFDLQKFESNFSLDKVITGIFSVYQELLGLEFKEKIMADKWHHDVQLFEVYNKTTLEQKNLEQKGEKIGEFYLDLYPRPGKFSGCGVGDLSPGADISHLPELVSKLNSTRQLPIIGLIGNFPIDKSLSFTKEVVTLFHEFGHVIHYVCTKTHLPNFYNFIYEKDFVEMPSQMMENFCFNEKVLNKISKNPVTKEMIEKVKNINTTDIIIERIRRLILSEFDYFIHSLSDSNQIESLDIEKEFIRIQEEVRTPLLAEQGECFASSFSHITNSYDVGYFGYLMSESYALDIFVNKFEKNPLDPTVGIEYRRNILESGSSKDGRELIEKFLGREPNSTAYLEKLKLKMNEQNNNTEKKKNNLYAFYTAPKITTSTSELEIEKRHSYSR